MHGNLKAAEGCKYMNFPVAEVFQADEGLQFVSEDWLENQFGDSGEREQGGKP